MFTEKSEIIRPERPKSYDRRFFSTFEAQSQYEGDREALETLSLPLSIPTAKEPSTSDRTTTFLGKGNMGAVYRYPAPNQTDYLALKVLFHRDTKGYDNVSAVTNLRLTDLVRGAAEAEQKVRIEGEELIESGYSHITYANLQESYIPCQELEIGGLLQWVQRQAHDRDLRGIEGAYTGLEDMIRNHKGGLVSLINNMALHLNRDFIAPFETPENAKLYARKQGLPLEDIEVRKYIVDGSPRDLHVIPMLSFPQVFPKHLMGGINDNGDWFTVMQYLEPSMSDNMERVMSQLESAASGNGEVRIEELMESVRSAYDARQLDQISRMLGFLHLLGLTFADLKEENIAYINGKEVLNDLSALQKIGERRLYCSPLYMTQESNMLAKNGKLVGDPADDYYALNQIKRHRQESVSEIAKLTTQAQLHRFMGEQIAARKERIQQSISATMELTERGRL